jgi:TonB family protein
MTIKIVTVLLFVSSLIFGQEGLVKTYFKNGKVESEINYSNKVREGAAKFFYDNGNLQQELTYLNGKVDGLVKEYYENGKLNITYTIENGKKEGPVSLFREDGTYLTDIQYAQGKRIIENAPQDLDTAASQESTIKKTGNPKEENSDYMPPVIAEDNNIPKVIAPNEKKSVDVLHVIAEDNNTKKVIAPNEKEGGNIPHVIVRDSVNTNSVNTSQEVMPEPIGGMKGIYRRMVYPKPAKENKTEGTVKIEAEINESGDVTDAKVIQDIGDNCGESARITVFYTKFKPANQMGKPVKSKIVIPIEFKLNDYSRRN